MAKCDLNNEEKSQNNVENKSKSQNKDNNCMKNSLKCFNFFNIIYILNPY